VAEEQKNMKNSESQQTMDSVWGSFTGSFFDGPQTANAETVTSPPKKQLSKNSSESESLEIISPPITPASTLSVTSPYQVSSSIAIESESVEIIGIEDTPTSSELFSPDSVLSDSMRSPGSVEIISEEDMLEDLSVEEDSMSYNTVSEIPITVFEPQQPPGKAINRQNLHLILTATTTANSLAPVTSSDSMANSSDSEHTVVSERKSQCGEEAALLAKSIESFEYQTQSSTQSFEEISALQQSELSVKVYEGSKKSLAGSSDTRLRDQHSPNSSDDKSDVEIVKIGDQTSGQTSGEFEVW
jgi:TATA element modulatory factor